jgi:hypothetical protein
MIHNDPLECEVLWQTGTMDLLSVSVRIDHVPDPF